MFAYLRTRRGILISLTIVAAVAAFYALSLKPQKSAAASGLVTKTVSYDVGLPNYDIRTDRTAMDTLAGFRSSQGKAASDVADVRATMVLGEKALKTQVPSLKVVYNDDIRTPEIIAPDVTAGKVALARPNGGSRASVLKQFLNANAELIGARGSQVSELKVAADYTNFDGNLSFVELNQEINGVPVFRGEVKAGFAKNGDMFRVVNNFAPGLDYGSISTDFSDPMRAVNAAAALINNDRSKLDLNLNTSASTDLKAVYGTTDSATTAEKMYFPTEPGVAVPAWRVLIWQPINAYYVIVDARTSTMLWRKNITEDQTQSATYSVYVNPNAMINVADNPFPFSPGPTTLSGQQGAAILRTAVTRIGNEAPYNFNDLGWIADGGTKTDGNAVQAGLDRDGTDGIDANSEATSATRDFTYTYNPIDPNTNTGEAPIANPQTYPGSAYQQGTATHLFYVTNWYHDELYRLGFNEAARNFQHTNFTGQGVGNDRIRGEGQDSSGTNNANFSTPADGGRGRMQMYIWTGPNPDLDGNLDTNVVIHEISHGLSNRLHGNTAGLTIDMSRAMGEGWGDFYGMALLSEPADPIEGIYNTGAYDTYRQSIGFTRNYYYGIRRFPTAVRSFLGGTLNRPHSPITFADIDSTKISLTDGAFNPAFGGTADQVHNAGEIWCNALWEVRARFVTRLGWAEGNRRVLQYVTDGMKLAPLGPTFLTERNAIIAAATASGTGDDVADVWAGFAARGMGFSSSIQNPGGTSAGGVGTSTTRVTEAFDTPNLQQNPTFGVSDALGDNDGFFEPGEPLTLTIPLTNITGLTANNVQLQVVGGGSADYGTIDNGATVTRDTNFTVPAATACGAALTLTFDITSSLGPTTITRVIGIGEPQITAQEAFDGVTPPNAPAGWTITSSYVPMTFESTATTPDTAPNSMFAKDLPDCVGAGCPTTNGGSTELTSPDLAVSSGAALVNFRHKFNTEAEWDGGVLEVSIAGGAFADIITAGGSFVTNGYNSILGVSPPNPLGGRPAWSGDSAGYITTTARMPASAAGQNIKLRWRFGTDSNTAPVGGGWNVDTITFAGAFNCSFTANRARADFDGDGRTDLSVFRETEGNWYLNRSTEGFAGQNWGMSGDTPIPGDFDGDGTTDIAVYRGTSDPANPDFFILNSSNGTFTHASWGLAGDKPMSGDFDGDLKTDLVLFRPSNNNWYILNDAGFQVLHFGSTGDIPMVMDYEGDGRSNIAVYRANERRWYIAKPTGVPAQNFYAIDFGLNDDMPVPADYDGDGKDDIAVFRFPTGVWYVQSFDGTVTATQFGGIGDVPVPGDYDGDGSDDIAVFRNGTWFLNQTTAGLAQSDFGVGSDRPIPKSYIP